MQQGKDLNLRDLEVMHSQEIEHKTYEETGEELGICKDTIARTKKKQAYRDVVLASLEERGTTPDKFAENLIKLMKKKKTINIGGNAVKVDDNITQFNAVKKHGDILGVDAPKEFDLKHSMSTWDDDELQKAINESAEGLDGRIKNQITGTPTARIVTENTVSQQESTMARKPREQAAGPTND